MHIHGRNRVLLGALIAAFALLVPANAFASHDLGIYKVEQQVTLESDEQTADLSCYGSDYALDGMWRIDHADQDDNDLYKTALGRAVDVPEAYPSSQSGYHFLFEKNAIGRVQLKVFLTCIKNKTERSGNPSHQHNIVVTPHTETTGAGVGTHTSTTACPVGQAFISTPGYKINWTGGPAGDYPMYVGRMSTSWPHTSAMRQWDWVIDISGDPTATITWYYSCVSRKLPAAGGERHKLVYRYNGLQTDAIGSTSIKTVRQSCGDVYKAVVAGFSFTPGGPIADLNPDPSYPPVPQLWYLGMDPQPKSRDFKFLNGDPAGPHNVQTTAICLNYRTT